MLPTPLGVTSRMSRASLTRQGHWSAPGLGQVAEMTQGILPHEYAHLDEIQGSTRKVLVERPEAIADGETHWGPYTTAIRRGETVTGRRAPDPTDDRGLRPGFVEWMMGLPEGWVCDLGLSRTAELKMLGNGVCPAQAKLALEILDP